MSDRRRIEVALHQINFARDHTRRLLADLGDDLWFAQPGGAPNHVAWQVGHLAVAQYGLCMFRIRGRQSGDNELMPSKFRKQFSRGTEPEPDPEQNPSPAEIRTVFERIHQCANDLLDNVADCELREPVDMPYSVEATKLGGLYFCAAHEMLHAGQIGLLRRMIGKDPL